MVSARGLRVTGWSDKSGLVIVGFASSFCVATYKLTRHPVLVQRSWSESKNG